MAGKAGVIGSGDVGKTLANGLIRYGYDVMIGTNNPSKHEDLRLKTGGKAKIGTFTETAKFGEIVVLAVRGSVAEAVIGAIGAEYLEGKTVIDTSNPIAEAPPVNGVLRYFTNLDESLMERLQKRVPGARFVKAFSCAGHKYMVDPDFGGTRPTMFICGNDDDARKEVREILDAFGWETEDLGKAEAARAIEPLAMLWCIPGFLRNDWMHAFKILRP
ncbi:MAG TPA: NAD(P)-binding domain-containing protein [Bacteroidota bacterium]|nr:NAD(P)-binding domain-containing protein [Bacteroidota bacterium]